METVITINISYQPIKPKELLYLRIMLIFNSPNDMHLSVQRCANHSLNLIDGNFIYSNSNISFNIYIIKILFHFMLIKGCQKGIL